MYIAGRSLTHTQSIDPPTSMHMCTHTHHQKPNTTSLLGTGPDQLSLKTDTSQGETITTRSLHKGITCTLYQKQARGWVATCFKLLVHVHTHTHTHTHTHKSMLDLIHFYPILHLVFLSSISHINTHKVCRLIGCNCSIYM